jgi:hypothetical protein
MGQPTHRARRRRRPPDPHGFVDWRWTPHALQRMRERWPRLARHDLEAALGRGRVLQRRAARYDLLVILPGHGLAIFVVDHGIVVTGYPADGCR